MQYKLVALYARRLDKILGNWINRISHKGVAVKLRTMQNEMPIGILEMLSNVKANPYKDRLAFDNEIKAIAQLVKIDEPEYYSSMLEILRERKIGKKVHLIRNCPTDINTPIYDQIDPVKDKYMKKKKYLEECFLYIISLLTDSPVLAYETRNNGDFFQDVYAQRKYFSTQTQKSDGELYYHNDRTAHEVRADYISLLGIRCDDSNYIETCYVDGESILNYLSDSEASWLKEEWYFTPFDDYSQDSNINQKDSKPHSILIEGSSFRYYDTRTRVCEKAPTEAWMALVALKNAISSSAKLRIRLSVGDLLLMPNQEGLHCRNQVHIANVETARTRYLLKTYNFSSTNRMNLYSNRFIPGINGVISEITTYANGV